MKFSKRKRQIQNKVNRKQESKKYLLIPNGYERQYEKWLLDKEFEEHLAFLKDKNTKRKKFLESVKVDETEATVLFKRQKIDERNLYSIAMKFLEEKNLNLSDGVKFRLEGRNSVVIKYRDEDGNVVTERLSISASDKEQDERY